GSLSADLNRRVQGDGHRRARGQVERAVAPGQDHPEPGAHKAADASPLAAARNRADDRADRPAGRSRADRVAGLRLLHTAFIGGRWRSGDCAAHAAAGVDLADSGAERITGSIGQPQPLEGQLNLRVPRDAAAALHGGDPSLDGAAFRHQQGLPISRVRRRGNGGGEGVAWIAAACAQGVVELQRQRGARRQRARTGLGAAVRAVLGRGLLLRGTRRLGSGTAVIALTGRVRVAGASIEAVVVASFIPAAKVHLIGLLIHAAVGVVALSGVGIHRMALETIGGAILIVGHPVAEAGVVACRSNGLKFAALPCDRLILSLRDTRQCQSRRQRKQNCYPHRATPYWNLIGCRGGLYGPFALWTGAGTGTTIRADGLPALLSARSAYPRAAPEPFEVGPVAELGRAWRACHIRTPRRAPNAGRAGHRHVLYLAARLAFGCAFGPRIRAAALRGNPQRKLEGGRMARLRAGGAGGSRASLRALISA